uniref:LRRNT domain-containing protein n=1 Tax=Denticeps clupeoides TaxID=299321 RepID=A0AAY4CJP3_9TELE
MPRAIFVSISFCAFTSGMCPDNCQCKKTKVFCQGHIISTFPSPVPAGTNAMFIFNTSIMALKSADFDDVSEDLQIFDIRDTQITDISSNTFDRTSSKTSRNLLTTLPENDLVDLEELSLQINQITHLPADLFLHQRSLRKLYLSNNRLSALPGGIFMNMPNLTRFTLHENNLQNLSTGVFGPMSIQELWLYGNRLTHLQDGVFRNLTNLHLLVISRNLIETISPGAFQGLINIQEVSLHTNRIKQLEMGIFSGLPNLVHISLEHNQIKSLSGQLLHGVSSLRQLDLHNNSLINAPQDFLDSLQVVNEVLLAMNPWRCDRDIIKLRDWMLLNPHKVANLSLIKCQSPPALNATKITDLTDQDIDATPSHAPSVIPYSQSQSPTDKRRRPHTPSGKRSTPVPATRATTAPEQGGDTHTRDIVSCGLSKHTHLITALVCTAIITSFVICFICWNRKRRDSRNLQRPPKTSSVI